MGTDPIRLRPGKGQNPCMSYLCFSYIQTRKASHCAGAHKQQMCDELSNGSGPPLETPRLELNVFSIANTRVSSWPSASTSMSFYVVNQEGLVHKCAFLADSRMQSHWKSVKPDGVCVRHAAESRGRSTSPQCFFLKSVG